MKGSSFGYLVRVGIKSVFKNRLMSFAAIGVLVACMILTGSAWLLSANVNSVVGFLENQEIMVFVKDEVDEEGIKGLDLDLHSIDNITTVEFISKEQTLEDYKVKLEGDADLLVDLEGENNPYPNAYRVLVSDAARIVETVNKIATLEGVEKVNAPTDIAATIVEIKHAVYIGGASIVAVLAVVAMIIIANTIKITVFNRRKEINIMKFVGATDSFIRLPFVVEGITLGLIAATLAFFAVWGAYIYLIEWMSGNNSQLFALFQGQLVDFTLIAPYMMGAFAGAGVLVGVVGSMIFVRRYLKV